MKIHLPQAILRTLSAAAVLVSTPLAVTMATGSFFAGTASAAITVERTGGNFGLTVKDGKLVSDGDNSSYNDQWSISKAGNELQIKKDSDLYNKFIGNAFTTNVSVSYEKGVTDAYTPLIQFAVGESTSHAFKLNVEDSQKTSPTGKVVTRSVSLAGFDASGAWIEPESVQVLPKGSTLESTLTIDWVKDGGNLKGLTADGIGTTKVTTVDTTGSTSDITPTGKIVFNLDYITSFTVNIEQSSIVHYGNGLQKDYGTETVLTNKLGNAAAIVLNGTSEDVPDGVYEVTNSTTAGYVKGADVYIGGGAQLKITSTTEQVDVSNGGKKIYIDSTSTNADSTSTNADLALSSKTDDRSHVYLGDVALVGNTSTIDLSGAGEDGKIVLLGSITEEQGGSVDGGKTLNIISADKSGLTLGGSGSIDVGTLKLQNTTIYLNSTTGSNVQAGAVTVSKITNTEVAGMEDLTKVKGVLSNVKMSGSGIEKVGNQKGTVSYVDLTVKGTVSNLTIDHSTITLNGAGSESGGGVATPAVSPLAEAGVSTPSSTESGNSIIDTDIDNSTITLKDGTSIGKGTKVSNSTINVEASATVSGDLQNDLIQLKNDCSLTVKDAVLGSGTRFEAAAPATEATVAEEAVSTNPAVKVTSSTVVLGKDDLTKTTVLAASNDKPSGVAIYTDKLANVTSVSNITLSIARDLIDQMELTFKGRVHYAEIHFEGMKLSGDGLTGWVTRLTGDVPAGVKFESSFVSTGDVVTGIVKLGPSPSSLPEPTSATLTLLSLAALAARRRRRKC